MPGIVETATSELEIVFTADSNVSQSGFVMTHQTIGKFFKHFFDLYEEELSPKCIWP